MYTVIKKRDWAEFAEQLEEKSDIYWSDAKKPTEYNPFEKKPLDDLEICISEYDTLCLTDDSGDELLEDEFIERCALIKPKGGKNIISDLKKENAILRIMNTKHEVREELRRMQIQALFSLQQASADLFHAKNCIDDAAGWDAEHIGFERLETALDEIEKVKLLCLEDFSELEDLEDEEKEYRKKLIGDDENGCCF